MKFFFVMICLALSPLTFATTLKTDPKLLGEDPTDLPSTDKGGYLCAAMCGYVSRTNESTQGAILLQMMATGPDAKTAFAKLQDRCREIANKNPNVRPITLYYGYNISVASGNSLPGIGYDASTENACLMLY